MGLLDLPPEILDLIIDRTAPGGLESFVLSCKTVYGRAANQVRQHNALRRTWSHTTNRTRTRRGDTLSIIHDIARDPIIAEYIETLSLWDRRADDEMPDDIDVPSFREDEQAMQSIKDLLRHAEYYADADEDDWWSRILEEDRAGDQSNMDKLYATVALLSLLPNLKTLQLPDRWHEVREGESAEARSWRKATMSELACNASHRSWHKSPLTRVEFAYCCMDATGLSAFLENTPALEVFKYSHQTKWDGLEHDWNAGEMLEALANYNSDTIVELAITIDELHGEVVNGLSSFLRFTKLKKLEVDVECFCGPPLESGQRQGRDAHVPHGSRTWGHIDIPCMGDMLPDSMEELHVNTNFPQPSEESLRALFKNIVVRRKDKLLNLRTAIIRQYGSMSAGAIAANHDVVFEVFGYDDEHPLPRSMMPLWKREFNSRVGGIVFADG